jgi:hypothetical protein
MGFRSIGSANTLIGGTVREEPVIDVEAISPIRANPRATVRLPRSNINDSLNQRIQGGDSVQPSSLERTIQTEGELNRTTLTTINEENRTSARNAQLALAGAQFGLDIMNASTQYRNVEGQARFAIIQSRNQAADALYRGRQAAFDTQSEGRDAGEDALLALAAQGQDVQGAGAQRIVQSYEGMAEQNAAIVEANAMREALGFKLEEIAVDYQLDTARINRDQQYISSALTFGAQAAGAFI